MARKRTSFDQGKAEIKLGYIVHLQTNTGKTEIKHFFWLVNFLLSSTLFNPI